MKTSTLILAASAAALLYAVIQKQRQAGNALTARGPAAFETALDAANPGEAVAKLRLGAEVAPKVEQAGETVRPGLGDFLRGA